MSSLESSWLQAVYCKGVSWSYLLFPLSFLFWLGLSLNKFAFKIGLKNNYKSKLPVVVVGNISMGGTGKSPVVAALVEQALALGFKPAVISRGYKGEANQFPYVLTNESTPTQAGDEPVMLFQKLNASSSSEINVPVVIDPVRSRAVKYIEINSNCDLVISDDGLQHYALARDFEICVIDGSRELGNTLLFPAGPLRESAKRLKSVDACFINGQAKELGFTVPHFNFSLQPQCMVHIKSGKKVSLSQWKADIPRNITAVCAIGNPQRFLTTLNAVVEDSKIYSKSFPDHHAFTLQDFSDVTGTIVMTEKDAVKCKAFATENMWYLEVSAAFESVWGQYIQKQLKHIVKVKRGE